MIAFTVPGPPQGKARARTVYNPKLKRSISYTPDNTVLYATGNQTCVPEDRKNKKLLVVRKECESENYNRHYNKNSTSSWDFGSGVCF